MIEALTNIGSAPAVPILPTGPAGRNAAGSFAATLGTAREATARQAAEQLVAGVFVQPILAAAREARSEGPFGQGLGEQRFGPLLDAQMADAIVAGADWALVDRIAADVLGRGGRVEGSR